MHLVCVVVLLVGVSLDVQAAVKEDEVTDLPGSTFKPSFKHYSGYLETTGTKKLHYWFVESQRNPDKDPLVLWLNGGPGCSSMDGMLTEHGPFRVSSNGSSISLNPWAWNRIANVLYIESPAGVGYSYSDDKNYTITDDEVAADNHLALQYFLKKYPEYYKNDLYLTGESYGGIYIPTLSNLVMKDSTMNFKGIAVGNGVSDFTLGEQSLVYFGYFHGLWGRTLMTKLVECCCSNGSLTDCRFGPASGEKCTNAVAEASSVISQLNIYNMYASCYKGSQLTYVNGTKAKTRLSSAAVMLGASPFFQKQTMELYAAARLREVVELSPPCIDGRGITAYMNRDDVKEALHIADGLPNWQLCSDVVGMHYIRQYNSMFNQYKRLVASGKYKVLVYNGDVDMACNFLMDEWFVDSLGLTVTDEHRAWMYQDTDGSKQIGGYVKHFEKQVVFATIRGAGHMVPTDRPVPAYTMFEALLEDKRL